MVCGTFDWFHPGHRSLLQQASTIGNVIVVIARDDNVKKIKGRSPDQPQEVRKKIIEDAFPDARVVLGSAHSFLDPLLRHRPDILLLGYDQSLPPNVNVGDIQAEIRRAEAHDPEHNKSSIWRLKMKNK